MFRIARPLALLSLAFALVACGDAPTRPSAIAFVDAPTTAALASGGFTDISAGSNYSCGLKGDGSITCWGANDFGQLNVPAGSYSFVDAGAFDPYVCAVQTSGSLTCWGGSATDRGIQNPPAGTFSQVSIGLVHACGLKTDGSIACWGTNSHGQTIAPARNDFVKVGSGFEYTCGLRSDGNVQCWGRGFIGTRTVAGPWTDLATSYAAICMTRPDGSLGCIGRFGEPGAEAGPPQTGTWVMVDGGALGTCALDDAGAAKCWGNPFIRNTIPPAGPFVKVDLGLEHACALDADGAASCWGNPADGRLTPPPPPNTAPTATFNAPASVAEGSAIGISLTAVMDEDVAGVTYSFDCGSGYSAPGASSTASCATTDDGLRVVRGRVRDAQGLTTEYSTFVSVTNVNPVVTGPTGATILAGETFTGTAIVTDVAADVLSATINWGDGNTQWATLSGKTISLSHEYETAGTYTVTVKAMDDDGGWSTSTATVKVRTPAEGTTALSNTVGALITGGVIPPNTGKPMQATLDRATQSLESRDNNSGVNQLNAFQNQVGAAERSGRIPPSTATELTTAAEDIKKSAGKKKP